MVSPSSTLLVVLVSSPRMFSELKIITEPGVEFLQCEPLVLLSDSFRFVGVAASAVESFGLTIENPKSLLCPTEAERAVQNPPLEELFIESFIGRWPSSGSKHGDDDRFKSSSQFWPQLDGEFSFEPPEPFFAFLKSFIS